MTVLIQVVLMVFAAGAFAGTGGCIAVRQQRVMQDGLGNPGMTAVAVLLSIFASLCAGAAGGAAAILAVSLPAGLAGYAASASHAGLFRILTGVSEAKVAEGSELHT